MAKKIKFALELKDGVKAYTLEDLQNNFDMERAVSYFLDGKLVKWLEDRYYEELAAKVGSLDKDAPDFHRQLCDILGVAYEGTDDEIDVDALERLNEKRAKLQQLTDDEEILSHAGQVAFSQEELAELIDEDATKIYLCGEKFTIPVKVENRTYVGIIGKPEISIAAETKEELAEKNIVLENVLLPEHLREETSEEEKQPETGAENHKIRQTYHASKLLDFMLSDEDRKNAEKLFDAAQDILLNVTFYIDRGSRPLLEAARASNIKGGLQRWLERMG